MCRANKLPSYLVNTGRTNSITQFGMKGTGGLDTTSISVSPTRPEGEITKPYFPIVFATVGQFNENPDQTFDGKLCKAVELVNPILPDAPLNLTATTGDNQVSLTWVDSMDTTITSYQLSLNGGSWTDIPDSASVEMNATSYTVLDLTNGVEYTFAIRAVNGVGNGAPSIESSTIPGLDYDQDDDGLIEVTNLAQLNATRWDLDGDGEASNTDHALAYPDAASGMGCPKTRCTGYELTAGLDFDTDGSGSADSGDTYWNTGLGWEPIGTSTSSFLAIFNGNGYTISNLHINRATTDDVGLFGSTNSSATVRTIGIVDVLVTGKVGFGGLIGLNEGSVNATYSTGNVTGGSDVGGLVGHNLGTVTQSYSAGISNGEAGSMKVGGLVGYNDGQGLIATSYSTSSVSGGSDTGGLVARARAP